MVIQNLMRRKARTTFSALGIGVGISIMVAIFTMADDLINQATSIYDTSRGDIFAVQTGSEEFNSVIELNKDGRDLLAELEEVENVDTVYPMVWSTLRTERPIGLANQLNYYGVTENSPALASFEPVLEAHPGEPLIDDDDPNGFIVGELLFETANAKLPDSLKLKVGEKVSLAELLTGELADFFMPDGKDKFGNYNEEQRRVVARQYLKTAGVHPPAAFQMKDLYLRAVFRSSSRFTEASIYFPLEVTQRLKNSPDIANFLLIDLDDDSDGAKDKALDAFNADFDGLWVRRSDKIVESYPEVDTMQKFGLALSLVAALAGALGVLNTMLISVLERTREIGLLMAIGWSRFKIVSGVVREGLAVTLLGGFFGIILGYLEVVAVRDIFGIKFLAPRFSFTLTGYALGLALTLGFLASLYPAWRASRLTPMDALRYE